MLADIIASGTVPVSRLTEVFNQAAKSRIMTVAHGINRGAIPDLSTPKGDSDFYFVPARDPETAVARILKLVKTRIPRRFGWTYAPGDKVMQIENDYEKMIYNGDIGLVPEVESEAGELVARLEGRDLAYGFGGLDALVPAYAATVHKSQVSEYPAVVIPLLTRHYATLKRNLLYAEVRRGKRLVVLVNQMKAAAIAVRNASGRRRWSKLDQWLAGATDGAEAAVAGWASCR